jgi:hypothetical protein
VFGKFAKLNFQQLSWKNNYAMKITLLNTSILTAFGTFDFQPITLADAKVLVKNNEIESSIGHASTADILSELLEMMMLHLSLN